MTPHISATKGQIAKTVIMPGDPLRAKWIAENYLKEIKIVSQVRGIVAYTGTYKGKVVTVMAHGMGIPSIGIYSYELFKFYDVANIIRVGSAGAYTKDLAVGSVIIVKEAFSESVYAKQIGYKIKDKVLYPSQKLLDLAVKTAKKHKIAANLERIHSEDAFYNCASVSDLIKNTGAKAAEMESFGLFANADLLKKSALCLLTISDSLVTKESMTPLQRQTSFKDMIVLALEMSLEL